MSLELEKAQLMYKLAVSKKNWGKKYDRMEHYKRFQNLKLMVKELVKSNWLILHKKPDYDAISLNTQYKKEIIEFIGLHLPELEGNIQ